jgi:hypothetical protein
MFKSKLSKVIVSLLRRVLGVTRSGAKRLMRAMLRSLMAMGRRARLPVAGFVLPTVTMVLLVVILLTVAITLRSFDRGNIARNVRVNQQVLAAATPALDRAKAKIQFLLGPGQPTASTPSEQELYRAMSEYDPANPATDLYTFGGEKRLILKFPVNDGTTVTLDKPKDPLVIGTAPNIKENEAINTAWSYPVDTNSDGKFDTLTLYGIYFRTPKTDRSRKPLDARTRPMRIGNLNPGCTQGEGTVASLVGDSGWERMGGTFQKSFFVYTVNVPITQEDINVNGWAPSDYQVFQGTSSISALEYQQDQRRIPLSNNAVVYEDDLDISPGPPLNLNGRIVTNSNLLVGGTRDSKSVITLFQVSSKNSCFYDRENSKIVVGGNVINGSASSTVVQPVNVHLFKSTGDSKEPDADGSQIKPGNQSVDPGKTGLDVMYNNQAYSNRLDALVIETPPTDYPVAVSQAKNQTPAQALEDYFKERLSKVPFAEALLGTDGGVAAATPPFEGSGDLSLRPKDSLNWSPNGATAIVGTLTQPGGIKLLPTQLESRNPDTIASADSEENLGERVVVGNNLPVKRWDGNKFLGINDTQQVDGTTPWKDSKEIRTRTPQVTKIGEVGATERGNGTGETPDASNPFKDGFWEQAAAEIPTTFLDSVGGLRVITSAGVYDRTNSFLPPPKWVNLTNGAILTANATTFYDDPATPAPAVEKYPVVWPDSMPMSPLGPESRVYNNSSVAVSGIAPGTWGDWNNTDWSSTGAGLPAPQASSNFVVENAATSKQFAKGDLRMRATAVYHYALNTPVPAAGAEILEQTPFACVSSYYDPSTASTARNIEGLDVDVSGEGKLLTKSPDVPRSPERGTPQQFIGSNNGITYGEPSRVRPGKSSLDTNTGLLFGGDAILDAQANLVFPDGRFANGPLRTALQVEKGKRTLAQNSAIDSTNCALDILEGAITPDPARIPHGAIQEVAFLNGREIKAIDRDDPDTIVNEAFTINTDGPVKLTGNYNQPIEERQPLEIRATQLNMEALRGQPISGTNASSEWLLPNSGIIYASRDDSLPDLSSRSTDAQKNKRLSPSDYLLDPTRKPNGIVLIKGQALFRGGAAPTKPPSLNDLVKEKGLTLVSNVPTYIKGNFNLHGNVPPVKPGDPALPFKAVEEFIDTVTLPDWKNFYTRDKKLNPDFACRAGDPRLPDCGGDYWRQANLLADSLTLLSDNYRFGFRNEGDFDLRNNAGAAAVLPRRQQGFFNNNFVTNGLSSGTFLKADGNLAPVAAPPNTRRTDIDYVNQTPQPLWSSYFNNFVTPVQRRGKFPEYVMEACRKLPVSECGDDDWFVDFSPTTAPITAAQKLVGSTTYVSPANGPSFQAGSTVEPPVPELQRFPRRVAFKRTTSNVLDPFNTSAPEPLAITTTGTIVAAGAGRTDSDNALWFAGKNGANVAYNNAASLPYQLNKSTTQVTDVDGSKVPLPTVDGTSTPALPPVTVPATQYKGSQPLLIPLLQLMNVTKADLSPPRGELSVQQTAWIPQAEVKGTTFNLIIAAGDTPSRALDSANGDFNGGLQNLPRFLEAWSNDNANTSISTNIQGSLIQQNRSAFSTAPYLPVLPPNFPAASADRLASLFALSPTPPVGLEPLITYNIQGSGRFSYFTPPTRNWGYDVGLLSQSPDLFTQKFTTPPTKTQPAEYFREVGRDDDWVKTLMCGVTDDGKVATSSRPNKDCFPPA